ncbi:MAG: CxxxxCH/CxxCH domain-containing protein [bacterium]
MSKYWTTGIFSLGLLAAFTACSERKEPTSVTTHPSGWANPQSANFHGKMVLESVAKNAQNCASCHGADFSGGPAGVTCTTSGCHEIYPHDEGFADGNSQNFHAKFISEMLAWDISLCQKCHGADYKGNGLDKKNCYASGCHEIFPHSPGFADNTSADFHANFIAQDLNWNIDGCQKCHGTDYKGKGYDNKSCYTSGCHTIFPHKTGFADSLSSDFHAKYIAEMLIWNIESCQDCHGLDYAGNGRDEKNCRTCHTQNDGPVACNTCHGSRDNAAPPEDLADNILTTAVGVGAHQTHLTDTTLTTSLLQECSHCHIEPSTYSDPGHIDNPPLPAELSFSPLASDSSRISPSWNHETATCGSVYCHGAFEFRKEDSAFPWGYADSTIVGNNAELIWTSVGTGQAECGTCHDLPPKGHVGIAEATCNVCHGRVVDADFNIIDKDLHINGKIEVF